MATNIFAEIDQEIEEAAARAKANGGNVFFFKLADGQRAKVRFLLDLNEGMSLYRHKVYNPGTNKFDVNAICTRTAGMDLGESFCKYCQEAERTNSKELTAVKYFIWPVWVYQMAGPTKDERGHIQRDAKGNVIEEVLKYKDKDGNVHDQSGIRYIEVKGTAPLLASLRENYRMLEEGDSFLKHDIVIALTCQNGDVKKPHYTVILRNPSSFNSPEGVEVPEQTHEDILSKLIDNAPPVFLDNPNNDPFKGALPARIAQPSVPARQNAPDF